MSILKTEKVVKQYANQLALDQVSIEVPENSIFGLLGPNGAGKTTLIRIINQITAPDSGTVYFKGKPLKSTDISNIGYLPEERGLYKKMQVGEQAIYLARLKGLSRHEALKRLKYWFEKFEIQPWWGKKVEELSKGMQQKVQFIVTILHEPELLIFDEPFSGFDPINTDLLKREILSLRDKGASIIFSTHNMGSVEELCDDIALINKAKVILRGEINDIRHHYKNNLFEFDLNGPEERIAEILNGGYTIMKQKKERKGFTVQIKMDKGERSGTLLQRLIEEYEVMRFQEVIPSMHDIFIRVVQSADNEKKEKIVEAISNDI